MTPVCLLASHFLASLDVEVLIAVGLLQVTTVVLALLGALLFTAAAQAITRSLRNKPSRDAVPFYWTVGFMGGGTIGVYLLSRLYFLPETRVALVICWALCLLWHAVLIHRAAWYVGQAIGCRTRWSNRPPSSRGSWAGWRCGPPRTSAATRRPHPTPTRSRSSTRCSGPARPTSCPTSRRSHPVGFDIDTSPTRRRGHGC